MAIFTNQATITVNGTTTASNIAFGEIVEVLSASKTAVETEYTAGDKITYVVALRNTGNTPLSGLTVTDNLGGFTFDTQTVYPLTYVDDSVLLYADGVLQASPTVTAGPPLVFSNISIPANGEVILVYQATVNDFANPEVGGTIDNTVTVDGDGISTAVTADETITASSAPSLSIVKSISPLQVTDNDRVTYTFLIQNFGNTPVDATDNAVINDTFDPVLSALTVAFNDVTWTEGTQYVYDETTGVFRTVPGQITVPAATYTQNPDTGEYTTVPGTATLTVTGTI